MVYRMVRPFLPVSLSVFLPIGGIFMNKFFDLLGYNNWSVFFFILMLFLLEQWMRTSRLFWVFLAGCMVGVSTGFRLPNLLQGTMVLGVFWYEWHSRSFQKAWGASLLFCVGGLFSLASVWGALRGVLRHGCTFRLCPPVCGTPEHQQRHRIQRRRNAVCAVFGPRERPSSTLPLCAAGPGRRSRASFLLPEAETGTRPHLPAGRRWSMLCRLFFLRPERFFARLARRATPVPVSDCCVLSVDMPGRRIRLYESFAPPEYFMRICHWNDPNRHSWNQ